MRTTCLPQCRQPAAKNHLRHDRARRRALSVVLPRVGRRIPANTNTQVHSHPANIPAQYRQCARAQELRAYICELWGGGSGGWFFASEHVHCCRFGCTANLNVHTRARIEYLGGCISTCDGYLRAPVHTFQCAHGCLNVPATSTDVNRRRQRRATRRRH